MPLILPDGDHLDIPEELVEKVSDGYHDFGELYQHRIALFLALCRALGGGWKSQVHTDGSAYDGWFIAGVTLPVEGIARTVAITYHLPQRYWDQAQHLRTLDRAPAWDGHTSAEVVRRLLRYATREETP